MPDATAISRYLRVRESGWLICNTHGLDDEGWGPIRASYLEGLLERLLALGTVEILPAGQALARAASMSSWVASRPNE